MSDSEPSDAVSVEYFAGLFDSRGMVRLQPKKASTHTIGHKFRPQVRIKTYDDIHLGLVSQFLDVHGIEYGAPGSSARIDQVTIENKDGIRTLYDLLGDRLVSLKERLAFLVDGVFELIAEGTAHMPRNYLAVVKQFEEITPRWSNNENRKYTASYFEREFADRFDIDGREIEPLAKPSVEYATPSSEYFVGFLDNAGRFVLQVNRSVTYDIGYGLDPTFKLNDRWIGPRLTGFVKQFLDEADVDYNDRSEYHHMNIQVSRIDSVERLIERVGQDLNLQYPQAKFLYETGIPAYRDGYHHTKQGFYELLGTFQALPTARVGSDRKYTPEYFESEWSDSITPVDFGADAPRTE
jgi:hypothetical protein